VRSAFASARWPGRFERFTLKTGQNRITWSLDGAHNVPAARALAETLKEQAIPRVELVFGALRDKDFAGIARLVAPFAERVTTTTVPSNRAADAGSLKTLSCWRDRATAVAGVEAALESVRRRARGPVLVTGSLYLVGAARAWLSRQKDRRSFS
jgi:folylpolyglutamate synthase/dihydropteroate synthase